MSQLRRVKYNILPPDGLKKGAFVLEASKMKTYAQSIIDWIRDIPTGIAVIQEHEHGTTELGRVVDGEWDSKTGLWAIVEYTPEMYARVKAMNIKRVSGGFAKDFADRKGNKRPLVMFELSLVTSPMYHDQQPAQELSVSLFDSLPAANRATLSMRANSIDLQHTTYNEETNMEANMEQTETNEVIEETQLEAEEEAPMESAEMVEEEEEEVDPMVALAERVLALEGLVAELQKYHEEEEAVVADEEEEAASDDEELAEDKEKEELKARLDVLRDIAGKQTNGWTEDDLVELRMSAPKAYRKKVAEFKSPSNTLSALPDINSVESKVRGGRIDRTEVSEDAAFLKAKEAFENGGSFFDTYMELTTQGAK